jgi:hypothetical protein
VQTTSVQQAEQPAYDVGMMGKTTINVGEQDVQFSPSVH